MGYDASHLTKTLTSTILMLTFFWKSPILKTI